MATIIQFGPYNLYPPSGLAPGKPYNVKWGPDDRFKQGTITATGHPHGSGSPTGVSYAAWVSDTSVENVITFSGDIDFVETNFYATFGNDGQETIDYITAYITVISA